MQPTEAPPEELPPSIDICQEYLLRSWANGRTKSNSYNTDCDKNINVYMKVKNQIAFSSKNSGKEYMNQQTSIPFPCQKMNQIFVCFFQVKQPRYFHEDV